MKLKNTILILLIYSLSVSSTLAHRLLHETFSKTKNTATAIYLDESTGNLVVQKYDLSESELQSEDYKFPKQVKSFASFYHPVSNLRPEIKEEKTVIDLSNSSPDVQIKLEKVMGLSREDGTEIMRKVNLDIYKNTNNMVISSGTSGPRSGFAIISDLNGKLVFAKGMRQKSVLPKKLSFPQDLVNSLASNSTKTIDISTPGNLEKSLTILSSTMKDFDFSQRQKEKLVDELDKKKRALDQKVEAMSLVKSTSVKGEKRELFFNFEDGSFYLRISKNNKILDDEFYPITDDENLDDLKKKLNRLDLYNEKDFEESFDEFYVSSCESLEDMSSLLPNLDSNIANILKVNDKLWGSYLENAVSNRPVVLEDGSMVLSISAQNNSHNVKISIGDDGQIQSLDFLNEDKATKDGLKVKKITENGKTYFKVVSIDSHDKGEVDQFFFDIENDVRGESNVAVYVKGKNDSRGIYDKNTYAVTLSKNKIISAKKRVHLSSSREDSYPAEIRKGSEQGVKTFFFKNFFSLEGKREKLADEVRSAVNSQIGSINKDGKIYLNKKEINNIVLNIVSDVEEDIPKLNANISKITAKTYEHSYKNFVSNIVPKMIKEIVPGESEEFYSKITNTSMKGLNLCLSQASAKSNEKAAEECLNIYVKEAPVLIGQEVMKYQLALNAQELLIKTAVSEYNKCIKENYDPTEDMTHIKGCIFKAMFTAVDKDLEGVVRLSLGKMENTYREEGKDIRLNISKEVLSKARKELRGCYKNKRYITPTKFKDNYNQRKLNSLETEDFKNDLLSCSSKIEQVVGRSVSKTLVDYELSKMNIEGKELAEISEKTVSNGYDNCILIQNGISNNAEKNGESYKVEAAKCTNLVTMTASELVITKTLKEKLGPELWSKLQKEDNAPHIMCFEDLRSIGRDQLFKTSLSDSQIDNKSADCLKESVVWASYHLAQKEFSNIFNSDPLYRNISLTSEKRNLYAKMIQSCFEEKLRAYSSISTVSASIDKIQDQCTVDLVMSDEASVDILTPVVSGILEDSGVDPSIIEKSQGMIVKNMRENVSKVLSKKDLNLDQVVKEFKNIQGEATYIIADQTIDKYVHDMIPDESAKGISKELRAKLFEGEYRFKSKLLNANSKEEIDSTVEQMTEIAAINLTEHATKAEGIKLLDKGLLKNEEEVNKMAKSGSLVMEECLEQRGPEKDLSEHLDTCVALVKSSVTYNVFSDQLKGILFDGPYAVAFSSKEKEEILKKFINDDFRKDIDNAYKKDSLNELQSKFTLSATSVIGEKVLKKSILDIYTKDIKETSPSYKENVEVSNLISEQANNVLQKCLVSIDGKTDVTSDQCINQARLKATSLVFIDKISPVLSLLSEVKAEQNKFLKNENDVLVKCVKESEKESRDYTDTVNSCLIESIFGLVSTVVKQASSTSDLLTKFKDEDFTNYKACLANEKRNLIENDQELKSNNSLKRILYTKIDQGESFWINYFNNSKMSDSQKRIDWAIEIVQKCSLAGVVPSIITSIQTSNGFKSKLTLNDSENEFSQAVLNKVKQFATDTLSNGLWLELPKSKEDESTSEVELKTISTYLDEYLPMVGDYLKKLQAYNSKGAEESLDKFLNTLRDELNKNTTLTLEEVKDLLMDSELIDLVIESEVSTFIIKEAKGPLGEEGVGPEVIEKLGSQEIIGELFKTAEGKKSIVDIKENFVRPMLSGEGAKEIPESTIRGVKHLLAKDTRIGGFVETLAGAIVQKNLEDKKPQNFATLGIASILGFESKDFVWEVIRERRKDDTSDSEQPVKKALEYFGDKILLPILLDEDLGTKEKKGVFSNSEVNVIDERKEKFSGLVEELMKL